MKNIFKIIACLVFLLSSCYEPQHKDFNIEKYRGCEIVEKLEFQYTDREKYVFKNDSAAFEVVVPIWFGKIYRIGDTIK